MLENERPIGFFDSGIGGLSVLMHAMNELPGESFIFYGDDLNAPYGTKSEEQIKELSLGCCSFLYEKGVKAIVIACNTATSASVKLMRERFGLPVISIEPAVKPAHEHLNGGRILVLATPATIGQTRYKALCSRVGCEKEVIDLPCAGLVELLEDGDFDKPQIEDYLRKKFAVLAGERIDGLVIGCTHYSFIADKIQAVAKQLFCGELVLYDGMYGMVRQLKRVLDERGLVNTGRAREPELYSSQEGSVEIFRKILGI